MNCTALQFVLVSRQRSIVFQK